MIKEYFLIVCGGAGALCGFLWGDWTIFLKGLGAAMVLDYLSGLVAAGYEGKTGASNGLNSKIGFKGILRKAIIIIVVAAGHITDLILGGEHSTFRDMAVFMYLGNELLSIIENAGRTGLPVPDKWKQAIEVLRNKGK